MVELLVIGAVAAFGFWAWVNSRTTPAGAILGKPAPPTGRSGSTAAGAILDGSTKPAPPGGPGAPGAPSGDPVQQFYGGIGGGGGSGG